MPDRDLRLIGAPMECGQRVAGCLMGPAAYRTAGIAAALAALGHRVEDAGDLAPLPLEAGHPLPENPAVHSAAAVIGWTRAIAAAAGAAMGAGAVPVLMGGDHALSLGSTAAAAAHAARAGRPLFVLWLDAHSDIHTPQTTTSGNLHGTPVGYLLGLPGFAGFPPFPAPVAPENLCLFGIRSVDPAEGAALHRAGIQPTDMRVLDETGIAAPLRAFLARVAAAGGMLHVSLDVDFLDPAIAPAVGTTVPGGATFREAHLAMELLNDSGLVTSVDLVELNPFLDERGRTARLMVDLAGSLFGRKVFDRPTRSFA